MIIHEFGKSIGARIDLVSTKTPIFGQNPPLRFSFITGLPIAFIGFSQKTPQSFSQSHTVIS
jgi:hypothetical protein